MNERELTSEFEQHMLEIFPDPISEKAVSFALQFLGSRSYNDLHLTLPQYITLLKKHENFTLAEVALMCNYFSATPFGFFESKGLTISKYEELAAEFSIISTQWEAVAGPYRKSYNQKIQIIKSKFK